MNYALVPEACARAASFQSFLRGLKPTQDRQYKVMTTETPDRFLRIRSVLDQTGLSRSTLYPKFQSGSFPRQIKISDRCAGWRESAVKEWLKNPIFYSVHDR